MSSRHTDVGLCKLFLIFFHIFMYLDFWSEGSAATILCKRLRLILSQMNRMWLYNVLACQYTCFLHSFPAHMKSHSSQIMWPPNKSYNISCSKLSFISLFSPAVVHFVVQVISSLEIVGAAHRTTGWWRFLSNHDKKQVLHFG